MNGSKIAMIEVLTDVGYTISPDSDQPGLWVWFAPSDGCESSFASEDEAVASAWSDAAHQTRSINSLSSEQWDAMSFDQQKAQMLSALTESEGDAAPQTPAS